MFDLTGAYSCNAEPMFNDPIVKPNRITGVGRKKHRPWSRDKAPDLKKKQHRKMAKASKRKNRR